MPSVNRARLRILAAIAACAVAAGCRPVRSAALDDRPSLVGVTACDPALVQRIVALVPADVLQIQIEEPIHTVGG